MYILKYHDINGNSYGIAVDYTKRIYSKNLSISTLRDGIKSTRKNMKILENELIQSGFTKINDWL